MPDDFGRATAAPSVFTFNGVSYRVAKQGPRVYGELTQFIKSYFPDPRIKAKELCAGQSDAVALEIWRELSDEAKDWPPTLESFEGNLILSTTFEGARQVVWTLLRRHTPGLTWEQAGEIANDLETAQINELIRLSMPEADFSPKSTPAPTTEDRGPVPA